MRNQDEDFILLQKTHLVLYQWGDANNDFHVAVLRCQM